MFPHEMIGRQVVVYAKGITYSGKLVEINEQEVYLESETGWITIPVTQIEQMVIPE